MRRSRHLLRALRRSIRLENKWHISRTWDAIDAKIETREERNATWEWEGDLFYRRYMNQYLSVVGGAMLFHEQTRAGAGVGYLLPLLIEAQVLIDHTGKLRLDLEKKIQWTRDFMSHIDVTFRQNQRTEYEVTLMYAPNWSWAAGLTLTEAKLGAGLEYRF